MITVLRLRLLHHPFHSSRSGDLRGRNVVSRPLHHLRIQSRITAIRHPHDGASGRPTKIATSPPDEHSNPHSDLASPEHVGACRGFLPRRLYDACPRGVRSGLQVCA